MENTYAKLGDNFSIKAEAKLFADPKLVRLNNELSHKLGLDLHSLSEERVAKILCGNELLPNSDPIAIAYAGHQFGHLSILGDGRALLLGEIIANDGNRYDLHLKGSGRTKFSRGGDGFMALGPAIREYIISHAMTALGVPTTQSLGIVSTGEEIIRDGFSDGAVLARIAQSHIRVGTFTLFAAQGMHSETKILADYSINRHYPHLNDTPNKYLDFLYAVMARQANLIAKWMGIGFIHGVMNTDNMTISGETIDYGPCAFMDYFNSDMVYSSIDRNGRYKYSNQPNIAAWNLARLAEALMALFDDDGEKALDIAQTAINSFGETYKAAWFGVMLPKFGLSIASPENEEIINEFLAILAQQAQDFTNSFRTLCTFDLPNDAFDMWHEKWQSQLKKEDYGLNQAQSIMRANNPSIIARNHNVAAAIDAGENGDFSVMDRLMAALSNPFDDNIEFAEFKRPPEDHEIVHKTFCGT